VKARCLRKTCLSKERGQATSGRGLEQEEERKAEGTAEQKEKGLSLS
jgi:hypothetical protein